MNEFIAKHAEGIAEVLSGFDRLVVLGTLRPISYPEGEPTGLDGAAESHRRFAHCLRSTVRQLLPADA